MESFASRSREISSGREVGWGRQRPDPRLFRRLNHLYEALSLYNDLCPPLDLGIELKRTDGCVTPVLEIAVGTR